MRGYDNKALFRTPVSFNKPCPLCNEDFMACDREGCWKLATDGLDRGILSNSQAKPEYSLKTSFLIGGLIAVAMLAGLGVILGY